MQALIISQTVYESLLEWSHRAGRTVHRLVLPELDGLAITPYGSHLLVMEKFEIEEDCRILGTVELPPALLAQARAMLAAQHALDGWRAEVEGWTQSSAP